MLCFDVHLNGKRIALAGVDDGVLTTVVTGITEQSSSQPALDLEIGGLSRNVHLRWPGASLTPGDLVEVRIVDADEPDAPVSQTANDEATRELAERRLFERLSKKYGK